MEEKARYIRTKDGVYEVSHFNAYATHKRKGETLLEGYKTSYIKNENIINQSENLAELCDEYVYVRNKPSLEKPLTSLIRDISIIDKVRKKSNTTVYGCIWTSKGLIYVAKMNEKGEFELL